MAPRRCPCQADLRPDGTCPHGCHRFRKPNMGPRAAAVAAKRKRREAHVSFPRPEEMTAGMRRAGVDNGLWRSKTRRERDKASRK